MRTSFAATLSLAPLIAIGVPANALTSPSAQNLQSHRQETLVAEKVAPQARARPRQMYRPARPYPQYRRDHLPPSAIAPPMERVPQVAPLAPRVGN